MIQTAVLALFLSISARAHPVAQLDPPPDTRDFICAPRLQLRQPQRCPRHGPGGKISELAQLGLLSPKTLPLSEIDPQLSYVPFSYVRAGSGSTPLYTSFEDAVRGGGGASSMSGGFVYFSYFNRQEGSGVTVYSTGNGYVRSDDVSRVSQLPQSPGLQFERTPDRPVAWTIAGGLCTSEEPAGPLGDHTACFTRHSVVQIYDTQRVGDWDWFMIGPNQWLEQRFLAVVEPDLTPPDGVEEGESWISVNLYEQTIAVYEGGSLKFATVTSSGRNGFWTQPGLFQVWAKLERDNMTGGIPGEDGNFYFLGDVPSVLYFDQARALHGTYWHGKFGTPTSRGCVNLAPTDANWVFNFAEVGTWVHVFDPSGNTPTDPSLYGAGGA
ncbi:MAG: L,D-transpeptidase [Anaerolineales bacterium]